MKHCSLLTNSTSLLLKSPSLAFHFPQHTITNQAWSKITWQGSFGTEKLRRHCIVRLSYFFYFFSNKLVTKETIYDEPEEWGTRWKISFLSVRHIFRLNITLSFYEKNLLKAEVEQFGLAFPLVEKY